MAGTWNALRARLASLPAWQVALGLYLLALAPRLVFALLTGRSALGVDEVEYDLIARNLAAGKGFVWYMDVPTAFRPPGYPFALAAFYWLFGPSYFLARIAQTFLAAAHAVLTYAVAREAFGRRAAGWAGLFVALYPPLVLYAMALLTENLFIPLLLGGLWCLLRGRDARPLLFNTLAGVLLGLAVLVRPSLTFFLPLLFLWHLWPGRQWRAALLNTALVLAIVAAMVTPWCVRNYHVTGQFVYLDTRTGYNLYIGYRPESRGTFDMDAAIEMAEMYRRKMLLRETDSDVVMHEWGKERALAFVRERPGRVLALVPLRIAHFWNLEHRMFLFAYSYGYVGELARPLLAALFALLLAPFPLLVTLSVVAVVFAPRFHHGHGLFLLLLGYYTALAAAVFGEARLHFPLVPVLAALAGGGIALLPEIRRRWTAADPTLRAWARRRAVLAAAVMLLFVAAWVYGIIFSWDKWAAVFSEGGHAARLPY